MEIKKILLLYLFKVFLKEIYFDIGKKKKRYKLVKRKRKKIYQEVIKPVKEETIAYFQRTPDKESLNSSFSQLNSSFLSK